MSQSLKVPDPFVTSVPNKMLDALSGSSNAELRLALASVQKARLVRERKELIARVEQVDKDIRKCVDEQEAAKHLIERGG